MWSLSLSLSPCEIHYTDRQREREREREREGKVTLTVKEKGGLEKNDTKKLSIANTSRMNRGNTAGVEDGGICPLFQVSKAV